MQQIEVTVSQSDWHKVGSVDGQSTNHRSRNWRSKMQEKTKVDQSIDDQFRTSSWLEISKSEIKFDLIGDGKTRP